METRAKGSSLSVTGTNEQNLIPISDEQAKAAAALSKFGQTVVEEGGQLTRYIGRVLGTIPEDAVGLVIGDPLGFVRAAIAQQGWSTFYITSYGRELMRVCSG
jgi:hypothetical protein